MKRSTMRLTRRTTIIASVTAAAVVIGGGVAFAFWTSSGSGSATAEVATTAGSLTVTQDAANPITGLYPGGTPQNVAVIVDNPTGSDIQLNDVTVAVTGTEKPAGTPNPSCGAGNFAITDNGAYSGEIISAAGSTGSIVPKKIQLVESGTDQNACKGAVVVLTLTAS